jgi:membrane-bound ClpP family serine protease
MSTLLIFMLLFLGTLLILLEIFFIPGFVVGLLGFILCIWGTIEAYSTLGVMTGSAVLTVTIALNIFLAYFGLKNLHRSPISMKGTISSRVNEFSSHGLKEGDTGTTISTLRPEGRAQFGDNRIVVWAFSGFIEPNQPIKIVRIADNKIFVTQENQ